MISCPKCGKENNDDCVVCYGCLEPLKKSPRTAPAPQEAPHAGPACAECGAPVDGDADFCDQCGHPLHPVPEAAGCPECGGKVEETGDGKGVCTECGEELMEKPADDPEPAEVESAQETATLPPDVSRILSQLIKDKIRAGVPLDLAVDASCRECLGTPPTDETPAERQEPCPVCATKNAEDADLCAGCGLAFEALNKDISCPRCALPCSGDTCACGAILTLPKLIEFLEPSVQQICPRCKQLFTGKATECAVCGADLLPAERLKAYAARRPLPGTDR
jgi:predicted amidophosphoribosyltransferase